MKGLPNNARQGTVQHEGRLLCLQGCWNSKIKFNMGGHHQGRKRQSLNLATEISSGSEIRKNILGCLWDRMSQAWRQRLTWLVLGQLGGPGGLEKQRAYVSAPHPTLRLPLPAQPPAALTTGYPSAKGQCLQECIDHIRAEPPVIQSTRVKQPIFTYQENRAIDPKGGLSQKSHLV